MIADFPSSDILSRVKLIKKLNQAFVESQQCLHAETCEFNL